MFYSIFIYPTMRFAKAMVRKSAFPLKMTSSDPQGSGHIPATTNIPGFSLQKHHPDAQGTHPNASIHILQHF